MDTTIVTEFNLICDDAYKVCICKSEKCLGDETALNQKILLQVGLVGSIFMVGMFFGAALSGKLCDIIGRKWTTFILCLTMAGAQALGGVSPNYVAFVIFRFFTAVGKCGYTVILFWLIYS